MGRSNLGETHAKELTFRKAIASAPHSVTTIVSLLSRVMVKAKITKNLILPINKNLVVSSP